MVANPSRNSEINEALKFLDQKSALLYYLKKIRVNVYLIKFCDIMIKSLVNRR